MYIRWEMGCCDGRRHVLLLFSLSSLKRHMSIIIPFQHTHGPRNAAAVLTKNHYHNICAFIICFLLHAAIPFDARIEHSPHVLRVRCEIHFYFDEFSLAPACPLMLFARIWNLIERETICRIGSSFACANVEFNGIQCVPTFPFIRIESRCGASLRFIHSSSHSIQIIFMANALSFTFTTYVYAIAPSCIFPKYCNLRHARRTHYVKKFSQNLWNVSSSKDA